jgi:OOP family OmpA-OmpF porin
MSSTLKKYLALVFVFVSITAFGQSKEVWLATADDFYEAADYASALKYYELVLNDTSATESNVLPYEVTITNQKLKKKDVVLDSTKTVSRFDYVSHQVAMCFHQTADYHHSESQFKLTMEAGGYPDDAFFYADALVNLGKYEDAVTVLETYVTNEEASEAGIVKGYLAISGCKYAMSASSTKKEVLVTMADTAVFNRGSASFAPMYWGGDHKMIFTSARAGGVVLDRDKQDSEYLCDLYWTERIDENTWGEAHNFGRPLNSAKHDASGCFTKNDVIFYTRWSNSDQNVKHIHLARMKNMMFYESYKMDTSVNVEGYKSVNPYVTKDGNTLYFSSDRPGGKGGMDIWRCEIDGLGNVMTDAENVGSPVNTAEDEVTPFFHKNTLYFSSTGHKGIGGLDIFRSAYNEDVERFGLAVNMGAPINSSKDDAYMIWDDFLQYGHFASDREDCPTGHCFDIYEVKNAPIRIFIEGFVYDAVTDDLLPNATIEFRDVNYNFEPFILTTDQDGYYSTPLDPDLEIFMKSQKPTYFADAASADTRFITQTTTLTQDFFLNKIPGGEITIPGIEYDFDSHELRAHSKAILDTLYDFLTLNDNLIVQINSHTDNRGDDGYNLSLSERRAKSCVDYLIGKGMPTERLISKGYGESDPAALRDANDNVIKDSNGQSILLTGGYINAQELRRRREDLHQINRRTAFKVVGEGFGLDSN